MGFRKRICSALVIYLSVVENHGALLSPKRVVLEHCKRWYWFKEGILVNIGVGGSLNFFWVALSLVSKGKTDQLLGLEDLIQENKGDDIY